MGGGRLGDGDTMMSDSEYHQPVGIYGWRKRCLYSFILFLMVVTVLNLALLVWILRVLNFSVDGMGKMRITEKGILMEGEAEFVSNLYTSKLTSNQDKPLFVESGRGIIMHARDGDNQVANTLALVNKTLEAQCESFEVKDKQGHTRFKVSEKEIKMDVNEVHYTGDSKFVLKGSVITPSVMGPVSDSLNAYCHLEIALSTEAKPRLTVLFREGTIFTVTLKGRIESLSNKIHLHGESGIDINAPAGDIVIKSSDNIFFRSSDESIYINAGDVYLKSTKISDPTTGQQYRGSVYQLCMCLSGRLYLSRPDSDCQATKDVCQ